MVPACIAGLGIGSYASVPAVLGPLVCRAQGVVAQAPTDFAMSDLLPVATMMPLVAGICAATLASKSEAFGHRRLAFICSVVYPGGVYLLSAAAVQAHSLPAFAASYAMLGGVGFYCGYPQLPPFLSSTWFPDRRGLVVSIYMSFFGGGMLVAVPVLQKLLAHFRAAPVRLGGIDEVITTTSDAGQRLAMVEGKEVEVIVATTRDLVEAGFGSSIAEGVFVLGTGSNGVCEAMVATGGGVFCIMQAAAWGYRLPATRVYGQPDLPAQEATVVVDVPASKDAAAEGQDAGGTAATTLGAPVAGAPAAGASAAGAPAAGVVASVVPASATDISGNVTLPGAMYTANMYLLFAGSLGVCMTGLPWIQLSKFMVNDIFGAGQRSYHRQHPHAAAARRRAK